MYIRLIKPTIDFILATLGLLLLSPVILTLTLILFIVNKGRPFFLQDRPGFRGDTFRLVKFRTMRDLYDEQGRPLPDKQRTTIVGKFIRSASLDELPQLINVIMGDMSLVGPRPLLVRYLALYTPEQARRHKVKPGITGWTQVNGRNSLSWSKKFELDVWYVDHISLSLDIKIIAMTVLKVFKREGIDASDTRTMEAFNGHN
ncbi:MAG: sugar transferase [Bacteroidetes bacterium]|nr:MAG: sugar transferase [Bacteroidota bacterium]